MKKAIALFTAIIILSLSAGCASNTSANSESTASTESKSAVSSQESEQTWTYLTDIEKYNEFYSLMLDKYKTRISEKALQDVKDAMKVQEQKVNVTSKDVDEALRYMLERLNECARYRSEGSLFAPKAPEYSKLKQEIISEFSWQYPQSEIEKYLAESPENFPSKEKYQADPQKVYDDLRVSVLYAFNISSNNF